MGSQPAGLGVHGTPVDPNFAARLDELERHSGTAVEQRLEQARQIAVEATEAGDVPSAMRARLVVGDTLQRLGRMNEAAEEVVAVNSWATAHGPRSLLARSHLVLSWLMENVGDLSGTLDHAVQAIDLLEEDALPRTRGNHLLRLADALAINGSVRASRERYDEAEALFFELGDRERQLSVLNNRIMLEYESGNVDEGLVAAERLLATSSRWELNQAFADSAARARLAAGRFVEAEEVARLGIEVQRERGDLMAMTPAELLLTLAEILVAQGRTDEAEAELLRCLAVCRERDLRGIAVDTVRVRAELAAARGCYEDAYRSMRDYHREWAALRSAQEEAAARTRQAIYETAEARREADRFRRLARTDPLTSLPNRRMVTDEVPRRLRDARAAGVTLAVVLIDVDHFKRVNDTYSHQAGDEVLCELATLLDAALDQMRARWEIASRLGGEEFLLVLVADDAAGVLARADQLRVRVGEHAWSGLPHDVRVTVSAGVALAGPEDDLSQLLTRADAHLYAAKDAGRDRVRGDGPV